MISQGKTPWADSACADCPGPGFLVLGAATALARPRKYYLINSTNI